MLLLFFPLFLSASARFGANFRQFLVETYDEATADKMERADLDGSGSFGGGEHVYGDVTDREAVILVHGTTNSAGDYEIVREHLKRHGNYSDETVYATTHGPAKQFYLPFVAMKCSMVKQVREFMQAVSNYTGRKVDVIGYSQGSPVTRKAILGGECVDLTISKKVDLGPPLTHIIDTFVSVAGANQGSKFCQLPFFGTCDLINGLYCNSSFLNDINKQSGYEGDYRFSIYSTDDDLVGHRICLPSRTAATLNNATQQFEISGKDHLETQLLSRHLQLQLVKDHQDNGVTV